MPQVSTPFGIFEIDPTDTSVSRAPQGFGEYGRRELEALDMFLKVSKDVLVLGAHIGTMVVPIAGKVETVQPWRQIPEILIFSVKTLTLIN
ncbi:MAG: hypothetical protein VXY54_12155 [Pseudomonadota bacterium]|nr:hypothetical protein [Pseudomonadota bacterium]